MVSSIFYFFYITEMNKNIKPAGCTPARLHSMAWKGKLRKSLLQGKIDHWHIIHYILHYIFYTIYSTFYIIFYIIYSILYILHSTLYILYSTLYSTLYILGLPFYIIYSILYILHSTLYILYSTLYSTLYIIFYLILYKCIGLKSSVHLILRRLSLGNSWLSPKST